MARPLHVGGRGDSFLRGSFRIILLVFFLGSAIGQAALPYCPYQDLSPHARGRVQAGWGMAKSTIGHFRVARPERLKEIEDKYRSDKARPDGLNLPIDGAVERFQKEHLDVDFAGRTETELAAIRQHGLDEMKHGGGKQPQGLLDTPYSGFSHLHYFTSGAGLWSRGGGTVKALLPLNLKALLSPKELADLIHMGDIVAAKGPAEVLKLAGRSGSDVSEAEAMSARAKSRILELTNKAMRDPRALNVLDVKLANVALLSQETGSYVHFDVWTSEQTHDAIGSHLLSLRSRYKEMTFHPDPIQNAKIQKAVGDYIAASEKLGESHLFGYQMGVYPLDPKTGESLTDQPAIGEGAGMAKHYLDESGRSSLLRTRGVRDWVFQNIEVTSDLALEYGAFRQSGKSAGAVLVPTAPGYAGGSPYVIRKDDGTITKQLIEASAVSKELKDGNPYFNSNTIFQSIALNPPENVGYESKENGRVIRLKMNAGDITLATPSAMIGGRAKQEYENFKTYGEYGDNGADALETVRLAWGRQLQKTQKE